MLKVVAEETARTELAAGLDEICREGARRMLAMVIEAVAENLAGDDAEVIELPVREDED